LFFLFAFNPSPPVHSSSEPSEAAEDPPLSIFPSPGHVRHSSAPPPPLRDELPLSNPNPSPRPRHQTKRPLSPLFPSTAPSSQTPRLPHPLPCHSPVSIFLGCRSFYSTPWALPALGSVWLCPSFFHAHGQPPSLVSAPYPTPALFHLEHKPAAPPFPCSPHLAVCSVIKKLPLGAAGTYGAFGTFFQLFPDSPLFFLRVKLICLALYLFISLPPAKGFPTEPFFFQFRRNSPSLLLPPLSVNHPFPFFCLFIVLSQKVFFCFPFEEIRSRFFLLLLLFLSERDTLPFIPC